MGKVDLVIRGGTVFDGSGGPSFEADIAVDGDRIVGIGKVAASGRDEIDARGRIVTPGWVDIHTHYDGQATWDRHMTPSSNLGATTVVMGNCGVGFAPVRPSDHETLIRLMEGVEDIPGAALHEGLSWKWESFPDYLDALDALPRDIDVAAQVPHGALRVYVMGERGAKRAPATAEEIARMGELVRDSIRAGALGFSSSRTLIHRTSDGDLTPTVRAEREEMMGIAEGMRQAGAGVFQFASDFEDLDREFDLFCEMNRHSGRPLSFSLVEAETLPGQWRTLLSKLEGANAQGYDIKAQVAARPVGLMLGMQGSIHPFVNRPSYMEIADRPLADRLAIMADPAFRARLLAEEGLQGHPFVNFMAGAWHKMFELGTPPNYEPSPDQSVAARAAAAGRSPQDLVYDFLLADEGRGFLYFPFLNYAQADLENVRTMLTHPHTLLGLSDGGAHCGVICDASLNTTMLTHWVRDRSRGPRMRLEDVVRRMTSSTADFFGFPDRGRLQAGKKADVNVIDFDGLHLHAPKMIFDLPAGGRRLVQKVDGYDMTICSGTPIFEKGEETGARPGKLVRSQAD